MTETEDQDLEGCEVEYLEEEFLQSYPEQEEEVEEGRFSVQIEDAISIKNEVWKGDDTSDLLGDASTTFMLVEVDQDELLDEEFATFHAVEEGVKTEMEEEVEEGQDLEGCVKCELCDKMVKNAALEKHFRFNHTFKYCDICNDNITEGAFKAHAKQHAEHKVWCDTCECFYKKKDFLKHRTHHSGVKRARVSRKVCELCGFRVEGKGTLNKHMREKHDEGQNYCELCDKYVLVKCYEKHMEDVHEDCENFCVVCQKSFDRYKLHMRTSHEDVVRFCEPCRVDVPTSEFATHTRQVHTRQSRFCETCNKEFFEYVCYKNHVKNIHLKSKVFKCAECDFTTAYRTSMDKHILGTHTRNQKYVCEICAKEFIVKDNLRKHIRMIHNGQQKSVCTYCGKVCHANRELINHVRLHTGDLPYKCEFCLRKFPKKWTLDNHRRIHTGEKPYKCSNCDMAFGASAQMKIHEYREHGVEKYRHVDRAGKRRKLKH